jgi:hypothetical protein
MRRLAMLTAVAALTGGCTSLTAPKPTLRPEPAPTHEARAEPTAPPPPPVQPAVVAPRPREVRIDNTSIEAFRTSWQRLRASLSPSQKTDLNAAVTRLMVARYGGGTDLPQNLRDNPIVPEMVRDQIAGKSYAEIIALAL